MLSKSNKRLIFGILFTITLCLGYLTVASYMTSPEGLNYPNPGHYPGQIGPGTFNASGYSNPNWTFPGDLNVTGSCVGCGGDGGRVALFKDNDGDGVIGFKLTQTTGGVEVVSIEDCNDGNSNIVAAPDGTCDGDEDTFVDLDAGGNDCDDNDTTVGAALTCYCDLDTDGYFSLVSTSVCQSSCSAAGCSVSSGNDCNDTDSNIISATDGTCDGDGDNFIDVTAGGADCDDEDSSVGPTLTCYCDSDSDTYYSIEASSTCATSCAASDCQTSSGNDCDDTTSNITLASDGTCDGDDDGFIDYTAYVEPSGDWTGWDLDDNNSDSSAGDSGTILYVTLERHRGCFCPHNCLVSCNTRGAMNSFCENSKPSKLQCNNIHAFINHHDSDIIDMPTNFGYVDTRPIYWYYGTDLKKMANDWSDMCNGSIEESAPSKIEGEYLPHHVWTGDTGYCEAAGTGYEQIAHNVCYWWDAGTPEKEGITGWTRGGTLGRYWLHTPASTNKEHLSCYRDLEECPPGSGEPCPLPGLYCACNP